MSVIVTTQRLIISEKDSEKRDSLDRRWLDFFSISEITPILLPNKLKHVKDLLELGHDGYLLTGGGDLVDYGSKDPERDAVEKYLIQASIETGKPLIGICRGMHAIIIFFGGSLKKTPGQVKQSQFIKINGIEEEVNSYHDLGCYQVPKCLEVFSKSREGVIKGVQHRDHNIRGIMWHPERMETVKSRDIEFFKENYKVHESNNTSSR